MPAEWYKEQPKNRNFLSPIGFKFNLELFKGVDFFCQSASIPEISMPFAEVPTPFRNIPIAPSGGVTFGDLNIRFIIDEDMENYLAIHPSVVLAKVILLEKLMHCKVSWVK